MSYGAFKNELMKQYQQLYVEQADVYALAAKRYTPEALAEKITTGLLDGSASKDGDGVKRTCAVFGIKHTYNAIYKFLKEGEVK